MWKRSLAFSVLIAIFTAQGQPATQTRNQSTFSVAVNLVKVPISVFDGQGNLVTSLHRKDFRIWEDSEPQEIHSFGIDKNPVSVALVLDASATTKTELNKIKEAAEKFADALSPGDRICVITFDDQVNRVLDWTDDLKKVRKALSKVQSGFRTALYDAMYVAAQKQLREIEGRKAIILLTDCLNNQSSLGFTDAAISIIMSQASLYVISKTAMVREEAARQRRVVMLESIYKRLFGDVGYIDEFFQKKESEMADLAEKTGGRCLFPKDYDQIKNVYAQVAKELKSKYYLTYISNQTLHPDSYHRIAVEYLPPASKIIYRQGYYYEPQPIQKLPY